MRISVLFIGLVMSAAPALASTPDYYDALAALVEMEAAEEETGAQALMPGVALPQEEEPVTGRKTVTSVESCLKSLPEGEAAAIRMTSLKPYEDCQKRLRKIAGEKKDETENEGGSRKSEDGTGAETPMNFVRVTEPDKHKETSGKPLPRKTGSPDTGGNR